MDLNTVEVVDIATTRDDVWPLGPHDAVLAGGTWLFSEPQVQLRRLVDITRLGWEPVVTSADGVDLAATCTIEQVARLSDELSSQHPDWAAAPLLRQCCEALLMSFKIWHTATVGGNVCLSFPAGAVISLLSALDGTVTVWRADGSQYCKRITDFVTGSATNVLTAGDVIRSVHLPASALRATTAFRKLAPSPLGRSGIVVIARRDTPRDGGRCVLSITAATVRPCVFDFVTVPSDDELAAAHATIDDDAWTLDAHGDPDWRRGVSLELAQQVCAELR
ncbi:FAD-binding molybdopterin dehydrogenase [Mycobacterium sp. MS1601]|uniref:FAD binding domain-containing protein n=1 Tax=Mycobacterium sp. MS1601 TaxID=1936029 RepID=UPI0009796F1B|nr:FAD binding domain-containing protein [Mycobacterium sp. MS1601]AQA01486.1 FAD-binding molybdopterin dehydrogenase [Mycobacterium sp. MS1601]